jgi:hypothetical protein
MLTGCASQRQLDAFNSRFEKGDLVGADQAAGKIDPNSGPVGNNLLWALQRGAVARAQQDYEKSNVWFDRAEEMLKHWATSNRMMDVVGTAMVNENTIPYRGQDYDAIMVNTYKAMNFMALGKDDLARVEFNRAMDRQLRARERFNKEIQEVKERIKSDKNRDKVNIDKTLENPDLKDRIRQEYPGLYNFEAYPDFVNPFSTYLAGLFFMITGDPGKAVDLLKESTGMLLDNQTVAQDFAAVNQWLDRNKTPDPCVWIVYEAGLGPVKEEIRIDLPLYLVSDDVIYTGIALPKLVPRDRVPGFLEIHTDKGWVRTELVASMDRVAQTELSKEFPGILARAVLSAVAKAAMQHAFLKQDSTGGAMMGFITTVYTQVSTRADLRIWTALPKEFHVARVPLPAEGPLHVRLGGQSLEIPLGQGQYTLVIIKKVSSESRPIWEVITR